MSPLYCSLPNKTSSPYSHRLLQPSISLEKWPQSHLNPKSCLVCFPTPLSLSPPPLSLSLTASLLSLSRHLSLSLSLSLSPLPLSLPPSPSRALSCLRLGSLDLSEIWVSFLMGWE
ncbi:hypothetical protein AMTRI_Chr04g247080 [Amborella trichopoda]